ncbi:helix-turn-helix domain-containing protein [Halalkalibacillus halophilus]|uniref:helix-turn-helix domain-containing protein n=1 Tax=Halalkalibacillus halophilus TaxID=392827 RepID=UPI0003FAD831|nr:helix-turn-helix domain-containing protein [Halalkalibacillus halophilus]
MNLDKFSKVLKQARLDAEMTQKQLAEGICTQAQISKLETGDEFPSSITLHLISKKLGLDAEYFFHQIESDRVDYIDDVKEFARIYRRDKNYLELNRLMKSELKTPLAKQNQEFLQFILWHLGISEFYLNKDKNIALKFLMDALKMKSIVSNRVRELEILNSIAIVLYESDNYQFSLKVFDLALEKLHGFPVNKDYTIELRLLYGASKTALKIGKLSYALSYSQQGVKVCNRNETLYLLGELYYQMARSLKHMNHLKAEEFFSKSISTFLLEEKYDYAEIVEKAYMEYRSELNKEKGGLII